MKTPLFTGCAAALVTPFRKDGSCDEDAFVHLIQMQIDACMDAIVLLGTTGEASTLTMHERERMISLGVKTVNKQMPVIVGTGANDTAKSIELTQQAHSLGADGCLCVTPYYNKTTQTGLIRHFTAIADSTPLPILLYNVPTRTGMNIHPDTAKVLSEHHRVCGIKEASGDAGLSAEILHKTDNKLPMYAGNDDLILPLMAQGACGAISVIANILPLQTRSITTACLNGCYQEARSAHNALFPLIKVLFSQVNPIPIKAALSSLGLIENILRLPLIPMEEPYQSQLLALMKGMNLL